MVAGGVTRDDMGFRMQPRLPARRVVSLVPSLTESVAMSRPGALVGATDWCTHPAGLVVERVRGPKNPNIAAIVALKPDVVLASQEENRRKDVQALRAAGINVWVVVICSVVEAFTSLRRMFADALGWPIPAWLPPAERAWAQPSAVALHTVIPVWRDPWMVVGSRTFTGDLAGRLGLHNLYDGSADRYPRVELAELLRLRPDLVVLPDEPYHFTASDGPEVFRGSDIDVALVEGRSLTWYGPSLATAREVLSAQLGLR